MTHRKRSHESPEINRNQTTFSDVAKQVVNTSPSQRKTGKSFKRRSKSDVDINKIVDVNSATTTMYRRHLGALRGSTIHMSMDTTLAHYISHYMGYSKNVYMQVHNDLEQLYANYCHDQTSQQLLYALLYGDDNSRKEDRRQQQNIPGQHVNSNNNTASMVGNRELRFQCAPLETRNSKKMLLSTILQSIQRYERWCENYGYPTELQDKKEKLNTEWMDTEGYIDHNSDVEKETDSCTVSLFDIDMYYSEILRWTLPVALKMIQHRVLQLYAPEKDVSVGEHNDQYDDRESMLLRFDTRNVSRIQHCIREYITQYLKQQLQFEAIERIPKLESWIRNTTLILWHWIDHFRMPKCLRQLEFQITPTAHLDSIQTASTTATTITKKLTRDVAPHQYRGETDLICMGLSSKFRKEKTGPLNYGLPYGETVIRMAGYENMPVTLEYFHDEERIQYRNLMDQMILPEWINVHCPQGQRQFRTLAARAKRWQKTLFHSSQNSKRLACYHYVDMDWVQYASLPKRSIKTLFFNDDLLKDLLCDMMNFLTSREIYRQSGIPYQRNILLYGPPGTGKTSLASAVASVLQRDLSVLSFNEASIDDTRFNRALSEIPSSNTILLLEDIDALFCCDRRGASGSAGKNLNVSFSAILNVLDGVMRREGLIIIMTTNFKEGLDEALLRSGRINQSVYIGPSTKSSITKALKWWYPLIMGNTDDGDGGDDNDTANNHRLCKPKDFYAHIDRTVEKRQQQQQQKNGTPESENSAMKTNESIDRDNKASSLNKIEQNEIMLDVLVDEIDRYITLSKVPKKKFQPNFRRHNHDGGDDDDDDDDGIQSDASESYTVYTASSEKKSNTGFNASGRHAFNTLLSNLGQGDFSTYDSVDDDFEDDDDNDVYHALNQQHDIDSEDESSDTSSFDSDTLDLSEDYEIEHIDPNQQQKRTLTRFSLVMDQLITLSPHIKSLREGGPSLIEKLYKDTRVGHEDDNGTDETENHYENEEDKDDDTKPKQMKGNRLGPSQTQIDAFWKCLEGKKIPMAWIQTHLFQSYIRRDSWETVLSGLTNVVVEAQSNQNKSIIRDSIYN